LLDEGSLQIGDLLRFLGDQVILLGDLAIDRCDGSL